MPFRARISLPTYNALSDTNPDHYALFADQDNILIKEFARGTISLGAGGSQNITHNLGYIPFFLVYVNDTSIGTHDWLLVGIPGAITGNYFCSSSTTLLNIFNNTGGTLTFKYFIFYDYTIPGSAASFTPSAEVMSVSASGFNALTDTNPNDFIFHSDLNTFKIVHQEKGSLNITVGTSLYTIPHNSPLSSTSCILIFAQFPDGKVAILSATAISKSYNNVRSLNQAYFDNTNIIINYGGVSSNYTLPLVWYVFEASL